MEGRHFRAGAPCSKIWLGKKNRYLSTLPWQLRLKCPWANHLTSHCSSGAAHWPATENNGYSRQLPGVPRAAAAGWRKCASPANLPSIKSMSAKELIAEIADSVNFCSNTFMFIFSLTELQVRKLAWILVCHCTTLHCTIKALLNFVIQSKLGQRWRSWAGTLR